MDDYSLSLDEFSTPRLAIVGAQSLRRYTTNILARGFQEIGWDLVPLDSSASAVVQLHGAPHSFDDDADILASLEQGRGAQYPSRTIVLIHRPDEIVVHHPRLGEILAGLPNRFIVALLGPLHSTDPWLSAAKRRIAVIPHGFFSTIPPEGPSGRVVVGSHTSWGEMRDPAHVVSLLIEIFKRVEPGAVVGYLGGESTPGSARLSEEGVKELCSRVSCGPKIEVVPDYGLVTDANAKHVIVVNPGGNEPTEMQPTFNVQLYHLFGQIRTGENSGSLHIRPSIPVVIEMNGADRTEKLEVVKVPYGDVNSITSIILESTAAKIAELIHSGQYRQMLAHNVSRAEKLSPRYVAEKCSKFLKPTKRLEA